jgi:drug/metabolite transporter (DMT)-like permease
MLHALWNFVTKKISGNLAVIWIGLCGSSLLITPVSLVLLFKEEATSSALPYIIATGFIHAGYFYFIGKSYEKGAISIVYPVARGVGVCGTAITAIFLLSEKISAIGGAGILFVCCGVLSIGSRETATRESKQAFCYALIVGILITGYSIVDKVGVSLINPVVYIWAMFSIAAICLAPVVLMMELNNILEIWNRMKWASGIIGLGSIMTYLLILYAFRLGNVSYAVAVREFAVVIGAALGIVFLGEKLTKQKVVGIVAIIVGLILIKLA